MGFDRPGKEKFRIPVSDTQAYRQFGNAVVVNVVEHIARYMLPFLLEQPSGSANFSKLQDRVLACG
jgi:site-specific DNA-cytosine methylase